MQTHSLPTLPMLDFESLPPESIALDAPQIEQAFQLSQGFPAPQQWQAYLCGLAYLGFEQWLQRYAPELSLQIAHSTLLCNSEVAEPAIANLEIGPFRVCLIALANPSADRVCLPEALLNRPDSLAHLYVIVQVQEEQAQVWVQSFLRYDELRQQLTTVKEKAGVLELPTRWFNPRPHQLLLDLQCLAVAAIPLPVAPLAPPEPLFALSNYLTPVINIGKLWFRGMLDRLAEQGGWLALPEPAWGLRSPLLAPTEELEALLLELRHQGVNLPPKSQAIYKDFSLDELNLRLYAVFAACGVELSEWQLLLILGAQPETILPPGTRLQVSDGTALLIDQTLEPTSRLSYLFGIVTGTWEEQFWVTIQGQGQRLSLPPLAFRAS